MSDLLGGEGYSRDVLADCARREVGMRKHVYPRWVADGRMSQRKADREIEMMEEIVKILEGKS